MQAEIHLPVKDFIETFLKAADIVGEVTFESTSEQNVSIKIAVESSQGYIIGRHGAGLESLQHIVTLIAKKQGNFLQYRVDVNNYQEERDALFLKKVTDFISEKSEDTEVLLWPMNAYERRLVHEFFLKTGAYATQSEDVEGKRLVRLLKK